MRIMLSDILQETDVELSRYDQTRLDSTSGHLFCCRKCIIYVNVVPHSSINTNGGTEN